MAAQFELLTRINNLSYQHHREVASIKLIATDDDGKLCKRVAMLLGVDRSTVAKWFAN